MQVHVSVHVVNDALGRRVRTVLDRPDVLVLDDRDSTTPDLLVVDHTSYDAATQPDSNRPARPQDSVVFIASNDNLDEHAELLNRGCLAVLAADAADSKFEHVLLEAVSRWREGKLLELERARQPERYHLGDFVTASASMQKFMAVARRVSKSDSSVLLLGETGVGKERLTAAIHAEGPRRDGPLVVVNCGAIPEGLIESELFGHEKGAFTGADRQHRGFFELAHGGTLLLDEIGELPLHLQVKLLRALQEREVRRVGGERSIPIDVRIIAATHRDIEAEIEASRFRSDLFYRLSVVTLTIPPLRERREDIPLLVEHYLNRFREDLGRAAASFSADAMKALTEYHWPGNVREVVNVVERAVLLADEDTITLDDLPDSIALATLPKGTASLVQEAEAPASNLSEEWFRLPLREAKRSWNAAFEKRYLQRILAEEHGRIAQVATRIGIDPRSLYAKMRAYELRKEDYR